MSYNGPLEQISDYKFKIPKSYKPGMRVDGLVYADLKSLAQIKKDNALEQVLNVACLPGIVKYSLAMPDIHWGYGFCIGGVAAFDPENGGVISPGGVGYDINCGIRLIRTNLSFADIKDKIPRIAEALFRNIPAGLGSSGNIKISGEDKKSILLKGAEWVVSRGMGVSEDLEHCEERGSLKSADPDSVSKNAYLRGRNQVGTLGSGNHFIEVQIVDEVFEEESARIMGVKKDQITLMIHSGSRGLGYQVCGDFLKIMGGCPRKYRIELPDRQLACAPLDSPEAKKYIGAMNAAANYAWANRQALTYLSRTSFAEVFLADPNTLGMDLVYDVAHNIAKFEEHTVDGRQKELCVHRKGATRSLGPGDQRLPEKYKNTGQPVIIPGSMGSFSYLLTGTEKAGRESFSSTCHGAGRVMSRRAAVKTINSEMLFRELRGKNIELKAANRRLATEEAPSAYKNIDDVIGIVDNAGLSKKVCRMRPLCVIKG